jgi:hypothetical protein
LTITMMGGGSPNIEWVEARDGRNPEMGREVLFT